MGWAQEIRSDRHLFRLVGGSFLVLLHAGARIAPSSTYVELIAGKDVIRIHGCTSVSCRERIPGCHDAPYWWSGISPRGPSSGETRWGSRRGKSSTSRTSKSGPCSNVRRWGLAAGARCQPCAFTSPQNEKSPRFVRHLYQQVADSPLPLLFVERAISRRVGER